MPSVLEQNHYFESIIEDLTDSLSAFEKIKMNLLDSLEFRKLESIDISGSSPSSRFAAVDSSSAAVLDAGCFMVAAYRSGTVTVLDNKISNENITDNIPVQLEVLSTNKEMVEANYRRLVQPLIDYLNISDSPENPDIFIKQPHPRDIDWLQLARSVEEWKQIKHLVDKLQAGDFILRDGGLRPDIRIPPQLVEDTLRLAAEKGIHIIGIIKRSSIPVENGLMVPLVPAVQKLGRTELPDRRWFAELTRGSKLEQNPYNFGRPFIVNYHPLSEYVFLTELNMFDSISPEEAFSKLAALCSDPVYIGYPYNLAYVHNKVILSRNLVEDIRYELQSLAFGSNRLTTETWNILFGNFHDVLDMNVY